MTKHKRLLVKTVLAICPLIASCTTTQSAYRPEYPKAPEARMDLALQLIKQNYVVEPDLNLAMRRCAVALGLQDSGDSEKRLDIAMIRARIVAGESERRSGDCIHAMVKSLPLPGVFNENVQYLEPGQVPKPVREGGVGLVLASVGTRIIAVETIEGFPAQLAGIARGDELITINGLAAKSLTLPEAVAQLYGTLENSVALTLLRPPATESVKLILQRKINPSSSDESTNGFVRVIDGEVLYINFGGGFNRASIETIARDVRTLRNERDRPFLAGIVDLRWSSGGLLNDAVAVSAFFLEPLAPIVVTTGRTKDANMTLSNRPSNYLRYRGMFDPISVLPPELRAMPLAILVSPATSSGGEIVAAALIDAGRGVAVGERTAGVGHIESMFPMGAPYALRMASAFAIRPNGQNIHEVGITPQVVVTTSEPDGLPSVFNARKVRMNIDPPIRAALEVLAKP